MSKLREAFSRNPGESFEILADHELVNRRLPGDFYSWWRRSTEEVQRYNEIILSVEEKPELIAPLTEYLLQNYLTTINFAEVATVLQFTPEEVEELLQASEQPFNQIARQVFRKEIPVFDGSSSWQDSLVATIKVDDIVPVVLIRTLLMKAERRPSLIQVYEYLESALTEAQATQDEFSAHRNLKEKQHGLAELWELSLKRQPKTISLRESMAAD